MKIYVMRHGEAQVTATSDKARCLNEKGHQQALLQGTRFKSTALSFDKVLVSPYLRALETFEDINQAYEGKLTDVQEIWEGITPYGNADTVMNYLSILAEQQVHSLLIVSHLPLVGEIVSALCGRNPISFYPATVAVIDWTGDTASITEVLKA